MMIGYIKRGSLIIGAINTLLAASALLCSHLRDIDLVPVILCLAVISSVILRSVFTATVESKIGGPFRLAFGYKSCCVAIALSLTCYTMLLFCPPPWYWALRSLSLPWSGSEDIRRLVDTSQVVEIEQQVYKVPLADGPARHSDVFDYYKDSNRRLFAYISRAIDDAQKGHRGLSLIIGAAGVGKSFVQRHIEASSASDNPPLFIDACKKRPNSHCCMQLGDIALSEVPDLAWHRDGKEYVVNRLSGFVKLTKSDVFGVITPTHRTHGPCTTVFIDGIDELHPSSATEFLQFLDEIVYSNEDCGMGIHVFVFGRPEGFAGYLGNQKSGRMGPQDVRVLHPAAIERKDDLDAWLSDLATFRRRPLEKGTAARAKAIASNYPWAGHSMGNLAMSRFIIEYAELDDVVDEQSLRDRLFDNICERAHLAHGRPPAGDPDYGPAIEDVAARYANVDNKGFFTVGYNDYVAYPATQHGVVSVRALLERSGLTTLDPADVTSRRYRFEPFWLHSYLVERHNARLVPGYTPGAYGRYMRDWTIARRVSEFVWYALILGMLTCVTAAASRARHKLQHGGVE